MKHRTQLNDNVKLEKKSSIITAKIVIYSLHRKTAFCPLSVFYLIVPKTEENHRAYSVCFTIILLIWDTSSWNVSKNYSICLNCRENHSIMLRTSKLQRKRCTVMTESDHITLSNNVLCWVVIWLDLSQIGRHLLI